MHDADVQGSEMKVVQGHCCRSVQRHLCLLLRLSLTVTAEARANDCRCLTPMMCAFWQEHLKTGSRS